MSATILLLSTGCNADMFNFFKSKKFQYILSSEITGRLYLDGKAFTSEVVYLHTAFSKKPLYHRDNYVRKWLFSFRTYIPLSDV